MMEYRREIGLVYSVDEALTKLNIIRAHGFSEHEIHLFAKDIRPLHSLKMYTEINIHAAGNWMDQMISLITGQNVYEVSLRILQLTQEEVAHYGHGIEQGAIFLFAEHEHPYEKEPVKQRVPVNIPNVVD